MDLILILLLALAIDLVIGEYPVRLHPTVWAGRLAGAVIKPGLRFKPGIQFLYGMIVSLGLISIFAVATWLLLSWLREVNYWVYIFAGAILLKPAFCLKQQWEVAEKTKQIIDSETAVPNEMQGLFSTVTHVEQITKDDIISSSVRSLAENASDFVTGPLFYFLFWGVPGAVAYRVINTLDNMIGYHAQYEYLGKFAARLDDAASFIPSRLTAIFFILAAWLKKLDTKKAWHIMTTEHCKTPGPNGGWPMAAVAGALGVSLFKVGSYKIGQPFRELASSTITEAVGLYRVSMTALVMVCLLALTTSMILRG